MRGWLVPIALAACSKAPPPASIGQLVVPQATSIVAWRPTELPFLTALDMATDSFVFECWRGLEDKLDIAYQVWTLQSSYVILVGDLPRATVESCARDALLFNHLGGDFTEHVDPNGLSVTRDGDLTVVTTKAGTVYAAWQDNRVVLGRRADVELAVSARERAPAWFHTDDLPTPSELATTAFVAIGSGPQFGNLLRVPETRWKVVIGSARAQWPPCELVKDGDDWMARFYKQQEQRTKRNAGLEPPTPVPPTEKRPVTFNGRVELTFATPTAATQAASALGKGAFAVPIEANLGDALAKLAQTLTDSTLVVRFDQTSFPNVSLEKLQAWITSQRAAH
jgi:hypothetical protein